MFGNKHRGWEQKQDGSRRRALQDGLHAEVDVPGQRVDTTFGFLQDKVEKSTSTDTDEYWEYGVTRTDENKVQDIDGGETSGGAAVKRSVC